jgi:hypothetical protein
MSESDRNSAGRLLVALFGGTYHELDLMMRPVSAKRQPHFPLENHVPPGKRTAPLERNG